MERIGNYLDVILESIPYTKPLAPLGKTRSAGITDLRYGSLIDEDWKGKDRFDIKEGQGKKIPLPKEVDCYSIAAVIGKETDTLSARVLGDSLVTVKSAFGKHEDPTKSLNFKDENTWVAYENTHLDLLNNPEVYVRIKTWLV